MSYSCEQDLRLFLQYSLINGKFQSRKVNLGMKNFICIYAECLFLYFKKMVPIRISTKHLQKEAHQ